MKHTFFFSIFFSLPRNVKYFYHCLWQLIKKNSRKNSVYWCSDSRNTWRKASIGLKIFFRNIFHRKVAIFLENVSFLSGKSRWVFFFFLAFFFFQRTGKLGWEFCRLARKVNSCMGRKILFLAYPGNSYEKKREEGKSHPQESHLDYYSQIFSVKGKHETDKSHPSMWGYETSFSFSWNTFPINSVIIFRPKPAWVSISMNIFSYPHASFM